MVDQLFSMQAQRLKKSINEHTSMEAYSINAPAWIPGIDFSDHRNYWAIDVPAVMVTDTAFYRNQGYHTAQDTVDTLNYEQMSEVVWGVYQHLLTYWLLVLGQSSRAELPADWIDWNGHLWQDVIFQF